MPEPYSKLLRIRQRNTNTFSGGLYNQPYLERLEFDECMDAEAEFKQIQDANEKIKLTGR